MFETNSVARLVAGEQYCFTKARVVGVGGGGTGGSMHSYGGAGSGHVSVEDIEIQGQAEVVITVGKKSME